MDLRQLRYFLASAEEGNMGRAAARLFVAQSALSRQVKQLEREVGAPLFHRHARGVSLTEVGEAFLPLARRALEAAAEALRAAREAARGPLGRIRVAPPEVGPWTRRVADGLERFRRTRPEVAVELVALPWSEHATGLREDRIDLGFGVGVDAADHPDGVVAEVLASERLGTALLPADHPLARRRGLSLDDLADLPMVLSDRHAIGPLHDVILQSVTRPGDGGPTVLPAPGSFGAVAQLVAGGAGWAAVLDLVREGPPPGTVARRVRGLDGVLELHVLRREKGGGPASDALVEALRSAMAPRSGSGG